MSYKGYKILSLMQRWGSKREMMGDDPPYLAVGTEVSAKYKGAFCEAKVRKIVRSVKCKIAYKLGLGTAVVTDDQIKGTLRAGSVVEVKHSDKKESLEATIIKIQDCSQYTVVFDDGDITTLRRTALCLKSGRHFAESETLDQLPLTHPEHFGNPVVGGRRGRRNRNDDSSDDDGSSKKGKQPKEEKEADIGKVVCVEISEKKKQKDNWFPGLVVAPTAQDTVKINVKEDYLVRSFKDGRYYTVPKKEATSFTREIGQKVDNNTLRTAVEKALLFLDRDELPPHWDRELLFGLNEISDSDSDAAFDSDTSDDEPREEKDHFVAQLYKFMDDRGTPINKGPTINGRDVDLYKLFKVVHKLGGCNRVTNHNQWKTVSHKLGFGQNPISVNLVKHAYKKFLHSFEDFYRKLGCTMVNHPRGHRSRHRSNRSLIRDKDKALPVKDKQGDKEADESKDDSIIEVHKEREIVPKEETKSKESVSEIQKPQRESRKDKPKIEKVEKKEDTKVVTVISKSSDVPSTTRAMREDRLKGDNREERIKMREMTKHDHNKEDHKLEKDNLIKNNKDVKSEENQRFMKVTRREVKEIKKEEKEKEDDKSKSTSEREVRPKKTTTSNPPPEVPVSVEESKVKKSRSLFSKMTGSKRIKPMPDNKIPRANKPLGLNSVRQKRTFSERMKAMVKKFKLRTGNKHLRHKSPPPENKECEDKKKIPVEECSKSAIPQLRRSKSKEEVSLKVVRKAETVCDKKSVVSSVQSGPFDKKQPPAKKRKDDDKSNNDEVLDQLPNYKSVSVGDKLKVYYGPTHESKVTYEAKVLSMKEEQHETVYLVHYTGWNTRYDEWIKRTRIADNLSWSPGRAKRSRQLTTQNSQNKVVKRQSSRSGEIVRSTTPSSVTSSSSRTKSPAVSSASRVMRSRARTRRTSGHVHTDGSESETDEEYDSDDMDSSRGGPGDHRLSGDEKESKDSKEMLMDRMRGRTYRRQMESGCESDPGTEVDYKNKRIKEESEDESQFERTRSRSEKKKEGMSKTNPVSEDAKKDSLEGKKDSTEVKKDSSDVKKDSSDLKKEPSDLKKESSEVHRSDRLRSKRRALEEKVDSDEEKEIKQEIKVEDVKIHKATYERKLDSKTESDAYKVDSTPQESDMKKKLKRKTDDTPVDEESKECPSGERRRSRRVTPRKDDSKPVQPKEDDETPTGREFDLNQIRSELKGISSAGKVLETINMVQKEEDIDGKVDMEEIVVKEENDSDKSCSTTPEDIYEFKEPEPFEFEVRSKCGDEKGGKMQRRTFGRMCDESNASSVTPPRKNFSRAKSGSPTLTDAKKNIKKAIVKVEDCELDKLESELAVKKGQESENENTTPSSSKMLKNTEESEIISTKTPSKVVDDILQPLGLFSDLPETEEGLDDENDSHPDAASETETETELPELTFPIQQTDQEHSFSPLSKSSSVEHSLNKLLFPGFTESLVDSGKVSAGNKSKTKPDWIEKDEDDDDEDPVVSALQRVQKVFCRSSDNEDSNDIDILTEIMEPPMKKEKLSTIIITDDSNSDSSKESIDLHDVDQPEEDISHVKQLQESGSNANTAIETSTKVIEEINLDSNDSEIVNREDSRNENEDSNLLSTSKIPENCSVKDVEDCSKGKEKSSLGTDQESEENTETEGKDSEVDDDDCEMNDAIIEISQDSEANEIDKENEDDDEQIESDEETTKPTENKNIDEEEQSEGDDEEVDDDVLEETSKPESSKLGEDEEKEEPCEIEEAESNLESLLCEETIPGSPAPSSAPVDNPPPTSPELPFASAAGSHPVVYKTPPPPSASIPPLPLPPPLPVNEAAPVMENTPPTTPDSSLSPLSNSPRGERSGLSPVHPENDSSKSNRDSPDVDIDLPGSTKLGHYSEEDTVCGEKCAKNSATKTGPPEGSEPQGLRKRRRSHKRSEENVKRIKLTHRSPRHSNIGSESDGDTSENSLDFLALHSRSPRPSKYNFYVQLDPELDASQRIAVLQQKLAELRKTYTSVKNELAGIDRRRKKLRRREREASVKTNIKPEVPCS